MAVKIPEAERRVPFTVRLTPFAIEMIQKQATVEGAACTSDWVRRVLQDACERKPRGRAVP